MYTPGNGSPPKTKQGNLIENDGYVFIYVFIDVSCSHTSLCLTNMVR